MGQQARLLRSRPGLSYCTPLCPKCHRLRNVPLATCWNKCLSWSWATANHGSRWITPAVLGQTLPPRLNLLCGECGPVVLGLQGGTGWRGEAILPLAPRGRSRLLLEGPSQSVDTASQVLPSISSDSCQL